MNIAIVLFPDMEELDFAGPLEVFGMASKVMYQDWKVFTVAEATPVKGAIGLSVNADYTFETAPPTDVIVVPGGFGTRPGMENAALIGYVQRAGQAAQYVTSVCTGAFLLHRAGFLKGRKATTYWAQHKALADMGDVEVVSERWVHDGNVITAAGVSAGIDMALYLVGVIKGPEEARRLQKAIEYDPAPPYAETATPA
jgi:transcriptional regulator GlxA family with amidase domain